MGAKRKFIESQGRKSLLCQLMRAQKRLKLNQDNETDNKWNEINNSVNENGPSTEEQVRMLSPCPAGDVSVQTSVRPRLNVDADAKLIEAVRARRMLYDPAHSLYSINNSKSAEWKIIGEELNASPKVCKSRWNSIRDNYRKSLVRRAIDSSAHRYKYAEMLGFLNQYLKALYPDQNYTEEEAGECIKGEYPSDADVSEHDVPELTEETRITVEPIQLPAFKVEESETEQLKSLGGYEYLEERIQEGSLGPGPSFPVHPPLVHAVDAFLSGLSPTLKTLAPVQLAQAKAEIFAVVLKYEMNKLIEGGADSNS